MGRPSKYTETLAIEICNRIALGESLYSITADSHMPDRLTILRWKREMDHFRNQYALAKEEQAETYEEMMLNTARNEEDVNRARLIVDTMKWTASKLKPKKYGDKVDHTSGGKELPAPILNILSISDTTHDNNRATIENEVPENTAKHQLPEKLNIMDDINA